MDGCSQGGSIDEQDPFLATDVRYSGFHGANLKTLFVLITLQIVLYFLRFAISSEFL